MIKRSDYIVVTCLLLYLNIGIFAQNSQYIWSDEFNNSGFPDSTNWTFEEGMLRNNEAQYYTKQRKQNAWVENGTLTIEASKERFKYAEYTSASITTKGKREFLYGRIEMRAKLPVGKGAWPSLWLLGADIDDVGWPMCGEIGIMEYVGFDSLEVFANVNMNAYNHLINNSLGNYLTVEKPWDTYHIYAIEWSHEKIDFYCDSIKYFTYENDLKGDNDTWPYDKPHFLILNLSIGGSRGGQKGIDDYSFPQKYYVDYIRYYSLDSKK